MPHNLEIKYESNIKMKSFKNFYIRNNNLVQLQNTSFESPLITTNSYSYYGDLSLAQKQTFKWIAEGNLVLPQGPILINNITVWGFTIPLPSGNQCLALQSTSFIEQSMYMTTGIHTISFYYHTRTGDSGNPINILEILEYLLLYLLDYLCHLFLYDNRTKLYDNRSSYN